MGLILSFLDWNEYEISQSEEICRIHESHVNQWAKIRMDKYTLDSFGNTCTPIVPPSNDGAVQQFLDTFNYSNRDIINREPELDLDLDSGDHFKDE